ncbi:MAG: hypothetical protein QGI32_10085, partial [Candidatus Latescibacteria bacterium]|nr:hypothetical protein [Candidatus Latescibacterota bacterium]
MSAGVLGLWVVCLTGCTGADTEFITAAKQGKIDVIRSGLASGLAADTAEPSEYTALMRAAE